MNISELPQEWQEKLSADRKVLKEKNHNTPYEIEMYNPEGTRFFLARRVCRSWRDGKGNSMPFGGGTYWVIRYGAVQFRALRNCMGQKEYELCNGNTYNRSMNGTDIPRSVETKKEALALLSKIGIFNS